MKNTRTKQTPIQRAMKIVTSITLLAMLFVLVIAGTLSGAFGVEENLVQNGKIEGNVASAEGVRTFQTIDLSGTFKNTTDTSININPDVAKRGGLYTTNENHLTNNKWETGNATTGGNGILQTIQITRVVIMFVLGLYLIWVQIMLAAFMAI